MKLSLALVAAPLLVLAAQPVAAEVVEKDEVGFVTRDIAEVEADTKATWLALISPAKYWNSAHSWSGDAANMTLKPQAGGCFCEKIPEDPDPTKITLEGSVEHMRVIHAFPERALRMSGGLGPLQSEPVDGILTIALSPTEAGGTRIVWEYHVAGRMRYEIDVISKAVDGVMSQQLKGLAELLGPVAQEVEPAPAEEADASEQVDAEEGAEAEAPAEPAPEPAPEPSLEEAIDAMADG